MSIKIVSVDPQFDDSDRAILDGDAGASPLRAEVHPFRLSRISALAMNWRDGLWMAMVLLTPLLAYGANLGFSPLMALAGLLGVGVIPPSRRWSAGMALLGVLLLWLLATEAWGYYQPDVSNLTKGRSVQALTGLKLVFELALYGAAASAMIGLRRDAALSPWVKTFSYQAPL